MSTRATYLFQDDRNQNICFYIHSDGYPEESWHYFLNMYNCKIEKAGFAGRFFRGNESAEFCGSVQEYDGAVEYFYTLKNNGRLIVKHSRFVEKDRKVELVFDGQWYEFVNEYSNDEVKLYFFKRDEEAHDGFVMTLADAHHAALVEIDESYLMGEKGFAGASKKMYREASYILQQINSFRLNANNSVAQSN